MSKHFIFQAQIDIINYPTLEDTSKKTEHKVQSYAATIGKLYAIN